jgi:hypothetical protein
MSFNFSEARKKARVRDKATSFAMIYMSVFYGIAQDYVGSEFTDSLDDLHLVHLIFGKKSVSEIQILPDHHAQNLSCPRRFLIPEIGRAARTQFSPGQIYDSHFLSTGNFFRNGRTASQFNVVGVCAKG